MNKIFFLCTALYLGVSACVAQAKKENKDSNNENNSLLWKISGKNLKSASYLFGTIHLICPEEYIWTDQMQKALDAVDKVAFELDMDDPALQSAVSEGMMLKNGQKLNDFFTPDDYAQFSEFVNKKLGMPISMFEQMKPMGLLSMLSMKTVNCMIPVSYEGNISSLASKANKEIIGLETVQDQLKIFQEINSDSMATQLLNAMNNWDSLENQYRALLTLYKEQDIDGLHQLILSSPEFKDNLDILLYNRNKNWIPVMAKLAGEQSVLFAVGAGHLWGEEGVINLLKKEGYTVEPVQ